MITYQDFTREWHGDADFLREIIAEHQQTSLYKTAKTAQAYARRENTTILNYQKFLYTISGTAVPDNYNANYKVPSNFFGRFVTQQIQYLLSNGVTLDSDSIKRKLGRKFDTQLQKLGRYALVDAVSFGFWNFDHLVAFRLTELAPLWDELTGALMGGVRFWQIDRSKPLRATLFEPDGYTEYVWQDGGKGEVLQAKKAYIKVTSSSPADGVEILDWQNYASLPIVPFWGNLEHQSEIVGIQQGIDCYDLIKSGFADDLDDASQIFWLINGGSGMDDIDLAKFVERLHTIKAAVVEDEGAHAEQHSMDVPHQGREAMLDRLRSDLHDDYMALDVKLLTAGVATATQIKAAYELMNQKADLFEFCVRDFMDGILPLAGIESEISFTRSPLVNANENVTTLLQTAQVLPRRYLVRKILETLGDGDQTEDVLSELDEEDARMMGAAEDGGSGQA